MIRINKIETFGTHEGPGIRTVIFVQGCNMRCIYCHNPDTQSPEGGKAMSIDEILKIIKNQKDYYGKKGGVTISGGEPLLWQKKITELFRRLKDIGVHTALDTNGSILDKTTKELLEYTDLVLLDIKHFDVNKHKEITGITNDLPFRFASYIESIKKPFWIRYVLMPGFTDKEGAIENLAEHFKDHNFLERVEILPYHTLGKEKYNLIDRKYQYPDIKPPTKDEIDKAKRIFEKHIRKVVVRN